MAYYIEHPGVLLTAEHPGATVVRSNDLNTTANINTVGAAPVVVTHKVADKLHFTPEHVSIHITTHFTLEHVSCIIDILSLI